MQTTYNRDKALAYWLTLSPKLTIASLAGEMISTKGNIYAYIKFAFLENQVIDILQSSNRPSLAQIMQSIFESYQVSSTWIDALYLYERNWDSKERALQNGQLWTKSEMRFPENVLPAYIEILSAWYEMKPVDFLSTAVPVIKNEMQNLHELVKKLILDPELGSVELAQFNQKAITLEPIAKGLHELISRLNEEFSLLSACTDSWILANFEKG
ncbi:MAG: hypothetical protein ACOYYS_20465 [Chloroflexota bacterium]